MSKSLASVRAMVQAVNTPIAKLRPHDEGTADHPEPTAGFISELVGPPYQWTGVCPEDWREDGAFIFRTYEMPAQMALRSTKRMNPRA